MDGTAHLRRTTVWVVVLALAMTLMPTMTASAASPIFATVEGTATLSGGLGSCGTGTFNGSATGSHGGVPMVGAAASATFNYCNPDIITGTASGTVTIDGHTCGFNWTRVLNRATIAFHSGCAGNGTAVFTPTGFNAAHIVAEITII